MALRGGGPLLTCRELKVRSLVSCNGSRGQIEKPRLKAKISAWQPIGFRGLVLDRIWRWCADPISVPTLRTTSRILRHRLATNEPIRHWVEERRDPRFAKNGPHVGDCRSAPVTCGLCMRMRTRSCGCRAAWLYRWLYNARGVSQNLSVQHSVYRHRPFPFDAAEFPDDLGVVAQTTLQGTGGELPALAVIHTDEELMARWRRDQ